MTMPYTAEMEPDWVVGYEIVDGEMVPMDAKRFDAFIQEGIDDLAAGRVLPHDEVMRRMQTKMARKSAA